MVLHVLAALAGVAFGLLQARWTVRLVLRLDGPSRMALPLLLKIGLWAGVMAALALCDAMLLISFAVAASLAMIGMTVCLFLKSRRDQEGGQSF